MDGWTAATLHLTHTASQHKERSRESAAGRCKGRACRPQRKGQQHPAVHDSRDKLAGQITCSCGHASPRSTGTLLLPGHLGVATKRLPSHPAKACSSGCTALRDSPADLS